MDKDKKEKCIGRTLFEFTLCVLAVLLLNYYFNPFSIRSFNDNKDDLLFKNYRKITNNKIKIELEDGTTKRINIGACAALNCGSEKFKNKQISRRMYFYLFDLKKKFSFLDASLDKAMKDNRITHLEYMSLVTELAARTVDAKENRLGIMGFLHKIKAIILNEDTRDKSFEEMKNDLKLKPAKTEGNETVNKFLNFWNNLIK